MKDPSTFLSAEEMTKRRTPRELSDWVTTIFDRYSESNEAKAYFRLKKGLCNKFLKEVWPLALLTKQLFGDSDQVICEPVLGNQKYDALIEDRRGDAPIQIKVEFTIAVDGHCDHLRMKELNEKGRASVYGDVRHKGTERTGHSINIDNRALSRDELTSKAVRLVTEALRGKAERPYGPSHWLCVKFDDHIWVPNKGGTETIRASVSSAKQALNLDFAKVFIVGSSGELLWELT
ncbi:MAG: hypothetical protein HZC43_12320 [Nitrosomonadales bacterium]|nr:hypothetical protein [Nitrosomonadales bacterium]